MKLRLTKDMAAEQARALEAASEMRRAALAKAGPPPDVKDLHARKRRMAEDLQKGAPAAPFLVSEARAVKVPVRDLAERIIAKAAEGYPAIDAVEVAYQRAAAGIARAGTVAEIDRALKRLQKEIA